MVTTSQETDFISQKTAVDHQGICQDLSASCVWHTTTEEVGRGSQGDPDPEAQGGDRADCGAHQVPPGDKGRSAGSEK